MSEKTAATVAQKTQQLQQPKVFMRSMRKMFHHLFKGTTEQFMKNTSWKKNVVTIEKVDHTHFFHSVNSMGQEQKHTTAVGGHFHEITVTQQGPGQPPLVKCGPAMRKIMKKLPNGLNKALTVPVEWDSIDGDGRQVKVADTHTHNFTYLGSDEIMPNQKAQQQAQATVATQPGNSWENEEVRLDVVAD